MAGQKARIDKDSNDYLTKNSRPDSEQETAYDSNLEKTIDSADRNGNGTDVFSGKTKKDRSRKADQSTAGTTGIGDTGTGLDKMESNPFKSVIKARFVSESENPGAAGASATSDSPSLGMMAVNNTDFRTPQVDVRSTLEGIALQAAEAFEMLDENSNVPDSITNELQNTAKAITKLYEFVSKNQTATGPSDPSDGPPVARDTGSAKPGINEEIEDLDEYGLVIPRKDNLVSLKKHSFDGNDKLKGDQHKIDANHNGKLDAHDFKLLRAKKTMKEATDLVFQELLRGKLDADY